MNATIDDQLILELWSILIRRIALDLAEVKRVVSSHAKVINLKKFENLTSVQLGADYFGFVVHGQVATFIGKDDGSSDIRGFASAGDCIDITRLRADNRFVGVRSLGRSVIVLFRYDEFESIFSNKREWETLARLVQTETSKYRAEREAILATERAEERIKSFAKLFPNLFDLVPDYMIASFVNIRPETYCRLVRRRKPHIEQQPPQHRV